MSSPTSTVISLAPEVIQEHDKLGPLSMAAPGPRLVDGAVVRSQLVAAIRSAADAARKADGALPADPHRAVHETRKAIRRLRALVDLAAGALGRAQRRALRDALRDARRGLGPARDIAVASNALIALAAESELAASARAIADAALADAAPTPTIADDVRDAVAVALAQAEAFEAALPAEVELRTVARGLSRTYAAARRARRKARHSERAIHRWRRRSKELGYQLTVLTALPFAAELRQGIGELDERLGEVVDRLLLTDFIGLYGHAGDPVGAATLLARVHDQLIDQRDAARKSSRALFARRPRRVRRRLRKAAATAAAAAPTGT